MMGNHGNPRRFRIRKINSPEVDYRALKPDSGSIKVNGKEISSLTEREMNEERRRMGMVFQYSALFDSMNVKENVAFGLRQHTDLSEEEIENITEGKLHLVGLDDVGDLMPADLSGGMKKRVSLARAIALNPQIILYDEPTASWIRFVRPILVC